MLAGVILVMRSVKAHHSWDGRLFEQQNKLPEWLKLSMTQNLAGVLIPFGESVCELLTAPAVIR